MEIVNAILKRYINYSLFELYLFFLLGVGLSYILQIPKITSLLNLVFGQQSATNFPNSAFFLVLWLILFFTLKKILVTFLKFGVSFREYNFKSSDWPNKWEYQGNPRLATGKDSLHVTDTNSGCILKNYFWKNVEISFDCSFQDGKDGTLGIIFRAQNLSDYLMVQINNKAKKITPHIRMEGFWETVDEPEYSDSLKENVDFKVTLQTMNENVKLFINGDTRLDWNIPTNSDIRSSDRDEKFKDTIVPKIIFGESYGRIGFRAFPGESAIIKNLVVKRLPVLF